MLEATQKGLGNILIKVNSRILIDHLLSQIFRKLLVADAQYIEPDSVVQKLHLEWFVRRDPRSGVQRNCVPGHLNPGSGDIMVLKELPNGACTVYFEPVISTAELLQQAKIMKCRADEQQLDIERLSGLSSQLVGPEEDAMRVVEEERSAELMEEPGCLPRQLCVWNLGLYFLELLVRGSEQAEGS